MKSLIKASDDFIISMKMLNELMTQEWENEDEQEKFAQEIVKSIVGDEKTMVTKIVNIQSFLQSIDDNMTTAREWKKDIDRQIKIAENMQKRVKTYALDCLKLALKNSTQRALEMDGVKISYQAQGEKEPVIIDDESKIPFNYMCTRITIDIQTNDIIKFTSDVRKYGIPYFDSKTPDKIKIRDAIKRGEKIEGAHIAPQAEGIRIKNILPSAKEIK